MSATFYSVMIEEKRGGRGREETKKNGKGKRETIQYKNLKKLSQTRMSDKSLLFNRGLMKRERGKKKKYQSSCTQQKQVSTHR